VVSSDEIGTIPGVPESVTFWHGPQGWLYTCPLGNSKFEITTMTREPDNNAEKVSWGQDATIEQNLKHFEVWFSLTRCLFMELTFEIGFRSSLQANYVSS
jgi:salicylate hydroxylase